METIEKGIDTIAARIRARLDKDPGPEGTYTFTNKEAACIVGALSIVMGFAAGDPRIVSLAAVPFFNNDEAGAVALDLARRIDKAQCPAYIREEVDKYMDEIDAQKKQANQTDKSLS